MAAGSLFLSRCVHVLLGLPFILHSFLSLRVLRGWVVLSVVQQNETTLCIPW